MPTRQGQMDAVKLVNPAQPIIDIMDHGPMPGSTMFAMFNLRGVVFSLARVIAAAWQQDLQSIGRLLRLR